MNNQPERFPYSHDKFVNRTDEVRLVMDKVQRLVSCLSDDKRVVIFHGARGSGKSWLLREIEYRIRGTHPSIPCPYFNLALATPPFDEAVRDIVKQIYQEFAGTSATTLPDDAPLIQWLPLLREIRHSTRVLVVLFDHVDESPHKLLALLEDRCLSPLSVCPKVLIVLAGRGKEYTWKGQELRFKSEECDLGYFDLSHTREQIEKQVPQPPPSVDEVWKLSGGYPWSNYILGTHYEDKAAALGQCLEFLLYELSVTEDHISWLRALCVLRAFSDQMIPPMLSACFDDQGILSWQYRQYRQVRQSLTATTLVKWSETSGGYVIDEALRRVLENWLYAHDQTMWRRLHTAARDLFETWKNDYPRTADRWKEAMAYHQEKLTHGPL
jgi:hypothetical protein